MVIVESGGWVTIVEMVDGCGGGWVDVVEEGGCMWWRRMGGCSGGGWVPVVDEGWVVVVEWVDDW